MIIATWNLQGKFAGSGTNQVSTLFEAESYMQHFKIDVFCLQEVGAYESTLNNWFYMGPVKCGNYHLIGTHSRGIYVHKYYLPYGKNPRCSMLIMVNSNIPHNLMRNIDIWQGCRSIYGISLEGVSIWNIHAPSTTSSQHFVNEAVRIVSERSSNFVLAGDFNYPARQLNSNYVVNYPPEATHQSGNTLDYFVSSFGMTNVGILNPFDSQIIGHSLSDHKPVAAQFNY